MPRILWLISTLSLVTGPFALGQTPPTYSPGEYQTFAPQTAAQNFEDVIPMYGEIPTTVEPPQSGAPVESAVLAPAAHSFNHATQYYAAPVQEMPNAAACSTCSSCGATPRRPCDLQAIWDWLCYKPLPCSRCCKSACCAPSYRPEAFEYFLPCAAGNPPRAPGCGCSTCGGH